MPTTRSWRAVVAAVSCASLAAIVAATAVQPAAAAKPAGPTTGSGTVFAINPVQSTGNQDLADNKDADSAAFAPAYERVALTDLAGTGYLEGKWANVRNSTGNQAYSPSGIYHYTRSDDRFEQVMAYYWVTEAQKYIQSLGFGSTLPAVNQESQDVRINQWGQDNSYSWDKHDVIRLGKGGVDDGEDGEVIVHEYGHAVHDAQVPGYGTSLDAGAIGEAFGDYLAVTVGLEVAGPPAPGINPACVADWDSVSYDATDPTCLRQIDLDIKLENRRNQALRRADLVAGAVGHPQRAGRQAGRHPHHQRSVRLRPGHVVCRCGRGDCCHRAGDVRRGRCSGRPQGVPGPAHSVAPRRSSPNVVSLLPAGSPSRQHGAMDTARVLVLRDLLATTGWVQRTQDFARSLHRSSTQGGLLLVGTPDEEPWHLAAHLDDEARFSGRTHLSPTLVRWAPPADAPPHLRVGLERLEAARRGETLFVVAPEVAPEQLLERVADARRVGATILSIDEGDPELGSLTHDRLIVPTLMRADGPLDNPLAAARDTTRVDMDTVQHLVSVAAGEDIHRGSLRDRLARLLDRLSGPAPQR